MYLKRQNGLISSLILQSPIIGPEKIYPSYRFHYFQYVHDENVYCCRFENLLVGVAVIVTATSLKKRDSVSKSDTSNSMLPSVLQFLPAASANV